MFTTVYKVCIKHWLANMNGNLREYFIRCQDVDSYIIMHCNYIKGPVGITETIYTDTMSSLNLQSLSSIIAVILI